MPDVLPIPPSVLPILEGYKMTQGIPVSWIAALCEAVRQETGAATWNPDFAEINLDRNTWRRYGVSGIWMDVPEVIMPGYTSLGAGKCGAGWMPWFMYVNSPYPCNMSQESPCTTSVISGYSFDMNRPPTVPKGMNGLQAQLDFTAKILGYCRAAVRDWCGADNNAIYLMWTMGCKFPTDAQRLAGCEAYNVPSIFASEMDKLTTFQALYADQLTEDCLDPSKCDGGGGGGGGGDGEGFPGWLVALGLGAAVVGGAVMLENDRKKKGLPPLFGK